MLLFVVVVVFFYPELLEFFVLNLLLLIFLEHRDRCVYIFCLFFMAYNSTDSCGSSEFCLSAKEGTEGQYLFHTFNRVNPR